MAIGVGIGVLALLLLMAGDIIPVSKLFGSTVSGPTAEQLAAIPKPPEPIPNDFGLFMYDTKAGTGAEAKAGDVVAVHYRGALPDGTPFDNSYDRGEPLTFTLGAGEVIKGWDEGIVGMMVGGERTMIIPPAMGYGEEGAGPIPPNSALMFDVALISVNGEEGAQGE